MGIIALFLGIPFIFNALEPKLQNVVHSKIEKKKLVDWVINLLYGKEISSLLRSFTSAHVYYSSCCEPSNHPTRSLKNAT